MNNNTRNRNEIKDIDYIWIFSIPLLCIIVVLLCDYITGYRIILSKCIEIDAEKDFSLISHVYGFGNTLDNIFSSLIED